ncbi:MAG: NAD(P)/FAD-dependent oxidoreductase [Halanaeroarchaeum sp.]
MTQSVVVVGGGLAGLQAAARLADAGFEVRLHERESTVGGRVRTERDGEFQFDRGFQVLLTAYPAVEDALDLSALDLHRFPAGATVCRPNHRSTLADPLRHPGAAIETAFNRDLTIGDKLRVLSLRRDLVGVPYGSLFEGPDATIRESLADRGFSERFVENFAAPFFGGIALDRGLETSKRVFESTFAMLAKGDVAVPARGMGAIPAQLADRARDAGATIHLDSTVERVAPADGTVTIAVDGTEAAADAVVVAADPPTSASLTGVGSIPTEGKACVTQYVSVAAGSPIAEQETILLNAADPVPNQVAPVGAVAPEYGPDDRVLLSATTLGALSVDDRDLFERTREALSSWFPEAALGSLRLERTVRCPFAQFEQPPGVHESLPDVRAPEGPVYLAGDYTRGSSIQGAIESGTAAARAVVADRRPSRERA